MSVWSVEHINTGEDPRVPIDPPGLHTAAVQRVLNDLKRTRRSRRRMIWSPPPPTPPPLSRQQVVSLSQSSCVSPAEFTEGGGGVREEPNHTSAEKPSPL
jgi:hypothetical protein